MWRVAFQENRLIPRSSNTSMFEYRKFLFVYPQYIKTIFFIDSVLSDMINFLWKEHIIYFHITNIIA